MRLAADNLWAVVAQSEPAELAWLESYLTVAVKGAEHSEAYANGVWDGTVKLFDRKKNRLASGLLRLVAGRAREQGISFQVEDVRVKPPGEIRDGWGAWLRDYQREAVEIMLRRGRGIVSMPTGGGKTSVFCALGQAVPIRWLVLVDTKDLMHQAADQFFQWTGERAGLAGDGEWEPRRFTVATLQTLLEGLGSGGRVDALLIASQGVIVDECQVLSPNEFRKVALATRNAWWRLGVSATPLEREDEADYRAIELLGPLIHDVPPTPLIAAGWLARPDIVMVRHRHDKMTGSYGEVYEAGVVLREARNRLVARLAGDVDFCSRPTLVFHRAIGHGHTLVRMIEDRATVKAVSGSANTGRRDSVRHQLRCGVIDVLVCSKIFNKGIDIPEVQSAVNAGGGASRIDALQKVGRTMRVVEGKPRVVRYWDVYDVGNRWLEAHSQARLEAYRSRGYRVRVVDESALLALAGEVLA